MTKKDKQKRDDARLQSPSAAGPQDAGAATLPKMKRKPYEREMRVLHGELVAMQEWVKSSGARICSLPLAGAATSAVALAVSTESSGSPSWTTSPSRFSQR